MLGILHLSDIHFVSGPNPVSSKIKAIQGAVQSESHDIDELLLVISGDVAYSGKQAEYSIAIEFVSDLEKSIRAIPALNFLGTVVIPGNHDLDFDNEGSVRPALLTTLNDTVGSLEADSDFVEQMTKPQNGFFNFQGLVSPGYKPASRLFWAQELSSKQGKILIRCFNTSWVSRKKEAAGQIIFPTQLVTSTDSENDAALVLSVFHHPYGWFNPDNGKTFRRMIETTSDVVLTGHEHDIDAYTKITNLGGTINYVEGAALQASGVQTGFNLLKVDLHACVYQSRPFEWQKDIFVPGSLASSVFARNQSLLEHQFVNNQEFKKQLDDIGTPFTHPVKVELTLSDVFVYPDLKVSSVAPKAGRETVVMSAEVLEYVSGNPLVSIAGAPTSGKTSLGKMLYMDMQQRKKLVPIFLTQDDIRGSSSSQVHAAIERAFERQYSKRMLNRFMQLEPEAKVVIFDDWHKMKLNSKGKALVVEALCKQFGRVIVLTDDASVLNQVADAVSSGELPHFLYCEIKQFGYRLRGELVTRWATLGREFDSEELEVSHRISSGEYLLDTLIGKGIVPAFPFFIISALQIESANQPAPYGSYGHIYQALLTTRMARVNSRNLNLKFAFLSLVAIEIFRAGHGAVSPSQLKTIHEKYEKEYAISADFKRIVEELELAQVLSITGDEVRFKHKYAYYYFVAQYFHDGMSDRKEAAAIVDKLKELANNAHSDDNAHILIFYLYMSKDRELIVHILENARKSYASLGMSDLDKDVEFANALFGPVVSMEAPSDDTDANRTEYRARRDSVADSEEAQHDAAAAQMQRELDFAFQSMNIMGQVLRNFPTDLRGDLKVSLTTESYSLGLRALRSFLMLLSANVDAFRRDVFKYLKMFQPLSRKPDEDVQDAVNKVVQAFTEIGIFGMLKRVSASVGIEELRETYQAARLEAGEDHLPTRLIDLAIKLDHFARIPEGDVEDLKKRLQGNPIVYTVLRLLVGEFLYLFPVDYKVRQRMVSLLDFKAGPATMSVDKKVKQLAGKVEP